MNNIYYCFRVSQPSYGKKNYICSVLQHNIIQCSCGTKHYTALKESPVLFEYDDANKIADGIFCGDVHEYFYVSNNTKEVFEKAGILGVSFEKGAGFSRKKKRKASS